MISLRGYQAAAGAQRRHPGGFVRCPRRQASASGRTNWGVQAMGSPGEDVKHRGGTTGSGVRRLILLRHAQSEESGSGVKDIHRKLTDAGREAAHQVALELESQCWAPDRILCSPSMRTRQTLDAMIEASHDLAAAEVKFIETFYTVAALDGQTRPALEKTIIAEDRSSEIRTVMCMGHNKGWEEAASSFAGVSVKLKTSNAALLEGEGDSWEQAFQNGFSLRSVVTPTGPKADNLVSLDEDLQPSS